MTDEIKIEALAALVGGWEKLARDLWEHSSQRDKARATKRLSPKAKNSKFITQLGQKAGRPIKYDVVGLGAIYIVLAEMKRLVLGGEKHRDRVKSLVLYVRDPKRYPILGLSTSMRDLLKEADVIAAVPEVDPVKLHNGGIKATNAIDSYIKYLSEKARHYAHIRELCAGLQDDISGFAGYENESG